MDYTSIETASGGSRGGSWEEPTRCSDAFLKETGLDWTVEAHPLHVNVADAYGNTREVNCDEDVGHFRRNEGDSRVYLGATGPGYELFQNHEAMELLEAVCGESGAEPLKGGSKNDGKFCWLQARMPENLKILDGDEVEQLFTLFWGHGGMASIQAGGTAHRMTCLNMLPMVRRDLKGTAFFKIRHTASMKARIEDAIKALHRTSEAFKEFGKAAQAMASIQFDGARWNDLVEELVPLPERKQGRALNIRERLNHLYDHGEGTHIPGVYGTGWGAWNAVTEYTTHERSTTGEGEVQRLNREHASLFGSSQALNKKAAHVILRYAA
jgi:phage/plasmid-like protein (TIGR03299 family)